MSGSQEKNPANVIRGLKAAIHNPNVSQEAKERDMQRLQEMGEPIPDDVPMTAADPRSDDQFYEDEGQGGASKVFLQLDKMEGPMKEVTKQMLAQEGAREKEPQGEEMSNRVLGGYKATLSNPRVSEEAKQHAQQVLEEHGAL